MDIRFYIWGESVQYVISEDKDRNRQIQHVHESMVIRMAEIATTSKKEGLLSGEMRKIIFDFFQ
jgi:hypothetical protein